MSDLISRQAAIDAIEEYADRLQMVNWKENPNVPYKVHSLNWCINTIRDLPSVDIDLSDYSDRLWKAAYERGKAEAEPGWIPVTERLPEIDMSHPHHEDYLVQYDSGGMDVASWSNVNRFWTDHVTEPYWNCVQFAKVVAYMPLPEPWKGEDDA